MGPSFTELDFEKSFIKTDAISFFYGFSQATFDHEVSLKKDCLKKFSQLRNKSYINQTENRPITHHTLRLPEKKSEVIETIKSFEATLSPSIKTICHIGIGGSITGPKMLHHALTTWQTTAKRQCVFISNHDEDHIGLKLNRLNIDSTLFVVVSKSGKTIEIEKILDIIIKRQSKPKEQFIKDHCIAITTPNSAFKSDEFSNVFNFDEGVGGRFSTTSYVGLLTLGLCFGHDINEQILDGAYAADKDANDPSFNNIALTQALIRHEQQHQFSGLAIVPYGESFRYLTNYMSQLICESLGKGSTIDSLASKIQHAPILMQGLGPDAQHTFFQQLHQGYPIIPVEFLITNPSQANQNHMLQQIIGQSIGLFNGQQSENPHHYFSGNRPSTITLINHRNAKSLGYYIALLENRIMFEGFLNNINSFDQPGVELGKIITQENTKPDSVGHHIFKSLVSK